MICIVSCFQTILLLASLLINYVYDSLLWIIVIHYHDSWCYNCYQSWPQNAWFQILIVTIVSGSICLYHMFDPYSFGSRWWVNDKSWYIYIYIYIERERERGPEKDRKVISYSNSDRLLIYLFGILLISKSHNPSIMHQNLSSPVSERTKIKTREPSMSGPTSDGSKKKHGKSLENHEFRQPKGDHLQMGVPLPGFLAVAWQSDTYEHLVQNLGHGGAK